MKRIKQLDKTGCGLACIAMLAENSYNKVRGRAIHSMGFSDQGVFYTSTKQLTILGLYFNIKILSKRRYKFKGWAALPDKAIVAINGNDNNRSWHWVVFIRVEEYEYVLDPKKKIKSNKRTDFGRMKPIGYLAIITN